jgi:hypothetical protein
MSIDQNHLLIQLVEQVPEFEDEYPLSVVVDQFADVVHDAARAGDQEFVQRALTFVEEVAKSPEPRLRNNIIVSFIEAAPWGELGVSSRFGPATQRLVREADPRMVDQTML